MTYGPKMTAKMRKALQNEIKAFDKAKTLREIELNSVSKPDVSPYQEWLEEQPDMRSARRKIHEPDLANPDQLSDENTFPWGKSPDGSADSIIRDNEIQNILTDKQWHVWDLCMKQAMTQSEAAKLLHISQPTLAIHLKKAINTVTTHFTEKRTA